MLQDISHGRLDNQYRPCSPNGGDIVVCIKGRDILIGRDKDGLMYLPTWEQVQKWSQGWSGWFEEKTQFAFSMQDKDYFLYMGEAGEAEEGFGYEAAATLRDLRSKDVCFACMTAWHIYCWYRANRYCGCCGEKTLHDGKERMMRCPACGNMIFPRIAPAVIIGLVDGDRILMSQYANRNYKRYALLAGFIEIGETAEEAVAREVMEEVGLRVKNIRYYGSQPWGIAGNLSLGYFCDLDGADDIHLDENELSMAGWYSRGDFPAEDDGISLTREMMRVFAEGREPR